MFVGVALVMLGNYYVYDSIAPVAEQLSRTNCTSATPRSAR